MRVGNERRQVQCLAASAAVAAALVSVATVAGASAPSPATALHTRVANQRGVELIGAFVTGSDPAARQFTAVVSNPQTQQQQVYTIQYLASTVFVRVSAASIKVGTELIVKGRRAGTLVRATSVELYSIGSGPFGGIKIVGNV